MMMLRVLTLLTIASIATAGNHNPGPPASEVVQLFDDQAVTTVGVTSTASYSIGLDRAILVDVELEGAEEGDTVTVTPRWERPGGNTCGYPVEHHEAPQAVTWSQGSRPGFVMKITPPPGAARMYLSASTTDTDGCTLTAQVIGNVAKP